MDGGQHRPFQQPCAGWTICSTGPTYRQKGKDGPVAAVTENTKVCGSPPTALSAPLPCGEEPPPECVGNFQWMTCDGGGCGPWPESGSVPPRTFNRGYQVKKIIGINNAGKNYVVGDVLTIHGGTVNNNAAQLVVDAINIKGGVTEAHVLPGNGYSISPAPINGPTGGTGTGAIFNLSIIPAVVDMSLCQKKGFKNVQANRHWHGRYGFMANLGQGSLSIPFMDDLSRMFPSGLFQPYTSAPPDTKYCKIIGSCEIDAENPCSAAANGYGSITNRAVSVNPLSGVTTIEGEGGLNASGWISEEMVTDLMAMSAGNFSSFMGMFDGYTTDYWDDTDVFVTSYDAGAYSLYYTAYWGGQLVEQFSISNGGCSRTIYGQVSVGNDCDYGDYVWGVYSQESLSWSDTGVNYSLTQYDYPVLFGSTISTMTAGLSEANSSYDVVNDCLDLIEEWNLNDDLQYPWRVDNNTGVAPLVTRNEVGGEGVGPNLQIPYALPGSGSWIDPNAGLYNGSTVGIPLPAGYGWRADGTYDGIFDFNHENWIDCGLDVPPDIVSWGAKTPTFLPQNCSQWTTDNLVPLMPPGQFIIYGPVWDVSPLWSPSLGVWVQDWIEIEDLWPSYNFFRPAGADKFVYNETSGGVDLVYQISQSAGSTIYLSDAEGYPLTTGVLVVEPYDVWGGQCVGGFFNVTKTGDSQVLLGQKVFNVPTDWASEYPANADSDTAFGRLRFPSCPGILGRLSVTSVITSSTTCQINTEPAPYFATNLRTVPSGSEKATLYDGFMHVLATNVTMNRNNDTAFSCSNSGATTYGQISSSKWMMTYGAPAYYWDDTYPKGNLVKMDWTFDYRADDETMRFNALLATCNEGEGSFYGYTCDCSLLGGYVATPLSEYSNFDLTQTCVPFTQCSPRIVRSPDFAAVMLDSQYGTRWQSVIASSMTDLLYQNPHKPPIWNDLLEEYETIFAWNMDNGTCLEDVRDGDTGLLTIAYYPHSPIVEAFINMPTAGLSGTEPAPPLPAGVSVTLHSPVDLHDSETAYPPGPGGTMPWYLHNNMCGCVESLGRFFYAYNNYVLDC